MNNLKIVFALFIIGIFAITVYYFYPEKGLPNNKNITKILLIKHKRLLYVYSDGTLLKSYKVSLGFNPVGKKQFEGDGKTPEGNYIINDKNANSKCYLNLT